MWSRIHCPFRNCRFLNYISGIESKIITKCVRTVYGFRGWEPMEVKCPDNKSVWITRILTSQYEKQSNFNNKCSLADSMTPLNECFYYQRTITNNTRDNCRGKSSCIYKIPNVRTTCNEPPGEGPSNTTFHNVLYRCIDKTGRSTIFLNDSTTNEKENMLPKNNYYREIERAGRLCRV